MDLVEAQTDVHLLINECFVHFISINQWLIYENQKQNKLISSVEQLNQLMLPDEGSNTIIEKYSSLADHFHIINESYPKL